MYESYFGLREKPFSLVPDPRFLYASRTHKLAFTRLRYGLTDQAGFVVLTGEVGTGKTTLLRHLIDEADGETVIGLVTNTHHSFGELMKWILRTFDIEFRGTDPIERYDLLVDFLLGVHNDGRRAILIVDEAQNLDEEALEQLRMLSNMTSGAEQLLRLVLVGQPELRTRLRQPHLRQFVQRISVDHDLQPLDSTETTAYIRHRLEVAGGDPALIDDEACAAIHYFARGLPRLVNALADLAFVHAFAMDAKGVVFDTVVGVVEDRQQSEGLMAFTEIQSGQSREALRQSILVAAEPTVMQLDRARGL